MKIPLSEPVTRESIPAKTFNEMYILDLNVRSHEGGPQDTIFIECCPYDQESGERMLEKRITISLPLWEAVQAVPEAAQAFGAILASIPALEAYQTLKNTPPAPPEPEPTPEPEPFPPGPPIEPTPDPAEPTPDEPTPDQPEPVELRRKSRR